VAHLIKADVNFAANWSEALHIVTAEDRVAGAHFQQPEKGAVVFVLSVCWERQPNPSAKA
jgi:hypothetical protein